MSLCLLNYTLLLRWLAACSTDLRVRHDNVLGISQLISCFTYASLLNLAGRDVEPATQAQVDYRLPHHVSVQ